MQFFGYIPLIGIVVLIYNILAFGGHLFGVGVAPPPGQAAALAANEAQNIFDHVIFSVKMVSGEHWRVTLSDLILTFGLITLFQEVIRATNISKVAIVNHALSMGVFVIALVEFLIVPGFATSTFFLILMMCLIDVIAGFSISIISARRDIGVSEKVLSSGL